MPWSFTFLPVFAVATLISFAATGQEETFYRVSGKGLGCLLENADKYLGLKKDLLIIAIDVCPDVDADPLMAVAKNVSPNIPDVVEDALDRLIVLTKEELACMAGKEFQSDAATYEIFPDRCAIRVAN